MHPRETEINQLIMVMYFLFALLVWTEQYETSTAAPSGRSCQCSDSAHISIPSLSNSLIPYKRHDLRQGRTHHNPHPPASAPLVVNQHVVPVQPRCILMVLRVCQPFLVLSYDSEQERHQRRQHKQRCALSKQLSSRLDNDDDDDDTDTDKDKTRRGT